MADFRQRYLRIKNRLEELAARHGQLPSDELPPGAPEPPSWGPLGSLLRQRLTDEELDRLMAQHRDMLRDYVPRPEPRGADW